MNSSYLEYERKTRSTHLCYRYSSAMSPFLSCGQPWGYGSENKTKQTTATTKSEKVTSLINLHANGENIQYTCKLKMGSMLRGNKKDSNLSPEKSQLPFLPGDNLKYNCENQTSNGQRTSNSG